MLDLVVEYFGDPHIHNCVSTLALIFWRVEIVKAAINRLSWAAAEALQRP